jgi:two-component system, chemotaxis family, chemotaxis protein CheY
MMHMNHGILGRMKSADTHLLIVDDSQFMRKALRDILESAGYVRITEAVDGKDALEKIRTEKPDFMFLDIIMPETNGIDVLKSLGGTIPAIVVSAVGQDSVVDEAKHFGAKDYIVKPFEKNEVLEKLQKHLL